MLQFKLPRDYTYMCIVYQGLNDAVQISNFLNTSYLIITSHSLICKPFHYAVNTSKTFIFQQIKYNKGSCNIDSPKILSY